VADTVAGIARFFGVTTSKIYSMNPSASSGIQPGDQLKIPPPTK
jgi:LysM repeat protein